MASRGGFTEAPVTLRVPIKLGMVMVGIAIGLVDVIVKIFRSKPAMLPVCIARKHHWGSRPWRGGRSICRP